MSRLLHLELVVYHSDLLPALSSTIFFGVSVRGRPPARSLPHPPYAKMKARELAEKEEGITELNREFHDLEEEVSQYDRRTKCRNVDV